jgi:hypothetical protein
MRSAKQIPRVKIRRLRTAKPTVPAPYKPRLDDGSEPEFLAGEVQGKKASAPEERLFNAMMKNEHIEQATFRYTIGAPRGLPGWKELDALVAARGMVYAIEVDTAFTHRDKKSSDVLHDAIVLADLRKQGMNVYPTVQHVDGERDLSTQPLADAYVKRFFG